jgi:pyruvate kinase
MIADLCGPKIRVGAMQGGGALLADGQEVVVPREPVEGTTTRFSTTLAELVDAVAPGDRLLLDDGRLLLEVTQPRPPREFVCRVVRGGVLGGGKGVNLPDTELALSSLTEKDRADVAWIAGQGFDYVALSFVRSAADIEALRALLAEHRCGAHVLAKIEKPQAVAHLDAILAAADAVMVARGDLGVEMDLPAVPVAQKRIAAAAQKAGKPCIIATQMLESMIDAPTPTRAEVSDIANAVLDHADAVMLSGETAVGKFPVRCVDMMNRTVAEVQAYDDETAAPPSPADANDPALAAVAAAVRTLLGAETVAAVAVYSPDGTAARLLAKSRLRRPILAFSGDPSAVRRMGLYYGVIPRRAEAPAHTRDLLALAQREAVREGVASAGENLVVVSGRPIGRSGKTNTLVLHRVE